MHKFIPSGSSFSFLFPLSPAPVFPLLESQGFFCGQAPGCPVSSECPLGGFISDGWGEGAGTAGLREI